MLNLRNAVENKAYIERLQGVIAHLHGCDSTWVEAVPVHEVFEGKTVWKGTVQVFNLAGHPKAKRAYGWHLLNDSGETITEMLVAVLELPPVTSPETAVKEAVAGEIRQRRKK